MVESLKDFMAPGRPCPSGCKPEELGRWIDYTDELATGKRVVVMSHWQVLYLDYPDKSIAALREQGLEAVQSKADNVISDSSGEWQSGFWVPTTPLEQLRRMHFRNPQFALRDGRRRQPEKNRRRARTKLFRVVERRGALLMILLLVISPRSS